jgi:RNA polymerase-binding transcription factor DksA
LNEERDRLNQELGTGVEVEGPITDDPLLTPSDAPLIDEAQEVQSAVLDMKTHRLRRVIAALQSIDDGTYGKCITCGREIDPRRLDADPAALLCIEDANNESNFETPSL